ncbi:MAG TPA: hypothetical protein VGK63_03170, partial [Candidatus Limnocylindrales bacterium]
QFMTLYEELLGFDDRAAVRTLPRELPKAVIVGANDRIQYGPTWGDVLVDLAGPVVRNRPELESLGWEVRVLEGLDHVSAMQPGAVLPVLRDWLGGTGAND